MQTALELILAGHSVTDIAAQVGVRRETVWRWRNDPSFASQVSVRQAQRRQSSHDERASPSLQPYAVVPGLTLIRTEDEGSLPLIALEVCVANALRALQRGLSLLNTPLIFG